MKETGHVKVLVVGDIMLDKYVVGNASRLSPEAPVPIVHVTDEYYTLGGCGNVVRNLRELGAQVDCMAAVAMDHTGEIILDELIRIGVRSLCSYGLKQSIVKERIIADERHVQMLRIDRETVEQVDSNRAIEIFKENCRDNYDVVIISDYAKGMITKGLIDFLTTNQNADIIVDPKPINGFLYNDVFMITPNEKEWSVMQLASQYNLKNVKFVLETQGSKGMILHDQTTSQEWPIKSTAVEVYNVSGAGDTVVAVMSLCLSMGLHVVQAAIISNHCAAYVVTQPGTTTVPKKVFQEGLDMFKGS